MIPSAPVMLRQPVIDGFEFARTGAELRGEWPVADFPRLQDALHSNGGHLRWKLRGMPQEHGRPALKLEVEGGLDLVCQRCLGVLSFPLRIGTSLQLAASQDEIDADPIEASGPERIVAGREMPVHDLIEDELLLALPIAPRHERCEGEGRAEDEAGKRQSPFAGLRQKMTGNTRH